MTTNPLALLLERMRPEEGNKLVAHFGSLVHETLALAIIERIPEDKLEEYEHVSAAGDIETLEKFLKPYIGNPETFAKEALFDLSASLRSIV